MTHIFSVYVTIAVQMLLLTGKLNLPGKSFICITDPHVLLVYGYVHFLTGQMRNCYSHKIEIIHVARWRKSDVL